MMEYREEALAALSKKCRYDLVRMIQTAGSGHIGGSLSSVDLYIAIELFMTERDRMVISHGHTAAAIYSVLGNLGFFEIEDAIHGFRKEKPFEGHPGIDVPGIEWCSGSLGQGLSVGCGMALAKRITGEKGSVFVVMGDGEQEKGQLQEAREFASKYRLSNLIAVIDCNGLQASGATGMIQPQNIQAKYEASGWIVREANGHSIAELQHAMKPDDGPAVVLARTQMGRGIPEIENDYRFHGKILPDDLEQHALERLKPTKEQEVLLSQFKVNHTRAKYHYPTVKNLSQQRCYPEGKWDLREAIGTALADSVRENFSLPIAVIDCDLFESVRLGELGSVKPEAVIECGIAEQNAASVTAAMAKSGIISIHLDFAMFNIVETYSQLRMADINHAPYKIFATHAGLDVGEDGKTHQCIDYINLIRSLHHCRLILPADANQADCAVRYALSVPEAVAVVVNRSPLPILNDYNGNKLAFQYGKADWMRSGSGGTIISCGAMTGYAIQAADRLLKEDIHIGVLNFCCPLCLDEEAIAQAIQTGLILTYEDHNAHNGLGSIVAEYLLQKHAKCQFIAKGIMDYGSSCAPEDLYRQQRLDVDSIAVEIKKIIKTGEKEHV
ncbi:MAG: transketolase [Clostridiaceae bacterium]|nr:transketolase [Clostridiaceae bacterium]